MLCVVVVKRIRGEAVCREARHLPPEVPLDPSKDRDILSIAKRKKLSMFAENTYPMPMLFFDTQGQWY